jgi:hypothetical protein
VTLGEGEDTSEGGRALDRTMWRARVGRGFVPVVRQATKLMTEIRNSWKVLKCATPEGWRRSVVPIV